MRLARFTLLAAALASSTASAQQRFLFQPPATSTHLVFGNAVELDGGFALGGSPYSWALPLAPGSVHVHYAASGEYFGSLDPIGAPANDRFGADVRADGGTAIVGAYNDDANGAGSGSAYVFDIASRTQLRKLTSSDGAAGDAFGVSVDIRGDRALVGALQHDAGATNSGAAYLFDVTTGQQLVKYTAQDAAANDELGIDCAMNGRHVIVGAWKDSGALTASGSAYLFDQATGQQLAKFVPPQPYSFRYFGSRVAINSNFAVVSYSREPNGFVSSGVVYVYELNTFQLVARLSNPQFSFDNSCFGSSLDINEDVLAIGALGNSVAGSTESGTVHLFDLQTILQVPPPQTTLQTQPSAPFTNFGAGVAVDGRYVLGGAPDPYGFAFSEGASFLFGTEGSPIGTTFCDGTGCPCGNDEADRGCTNGTGRGAFLTAAGGASVARDNLVLITEYLPPSQFSLTFMGGTQAPRVALGNGLYCVGAGPLYRFNPPQAANGSGTSLVGSSLSGAGIVEYSCTTFGPGGCIQPGSTWNFQTWYRDPAAPAARARTSRMQWP